MPLPTCESISSQACPNSEVFVKQQVNPNDLPETCNGVSDGNVCFVYYCQINNSNGTISASIPSKDNVCQGKHDYYTF